MADGDFDYCLADIAACLGVKLITHLPANELAQVKALINEAYRQCFIRPNGKRVRWAEQYIPGVYLPAPLSFSFVATKGATTIGDAGGGLTPDLSVYPNYVGSRLKVGTDFYTLATTGSLLEPYAGETGTVAATLYFSSYVLPVENLDLSEEPEIIGWGRLSPMAGASQEIRNRCWGTGDFVPENGQSPRFAGYKSEMETGDPLYYYIDTAGLVASGTATGIRNRFTVYPLPDTRLRSLRIRGNYVPAALTSGASMPVLPANTIIDTLLPIARAKVVSVSRRFNGPNRAEIIAQGQIAETKLDTLANAQKRKPARLRVKAGW